MTSVNVTTQTNTVTVQQGDATTVTIATQGPQGPAGAGSSNVVDDTSPQLGGDLQSNGNDIDFADNDKAIFGTGSDLQIFHDGSQSVIKDNGTGQLLISGENTIAFTNAAATENYARFLNNGAVELYHNNVKKVETSADGLDLPDNTKLQIGDNQDLQLFHTGSLSEIKNLNVNVFTIRQAFTNGFMFIHADRLQLRSHSTNESYITCTNNGSVELYYDNVKKAETTADGFQIQDNLTISGDNPKLIFDQTSSNVKYKIEEGSGLLQLKISSNGGVSYASAISIGGVGNIFIPDNDKVNFGSGNDLVIVHDGSDSKITNKTGNLLIEAKNAETGIKVIPDGAVELYHDNVKKVETSATGIDVTGNINLPDSTSNTVGRIMLGDGTEMQIQYDGGGGFIGNFSGNLTLHCNALRFMNGAKTENFIVANENSSVELYHDNVKKVETTSSGITVTGSVTTQDINMSNLNGTANEVDNTKGSWSIQEGADDLFLINRVSGKKYKFNLTEVS